MNIKTNKRLKFFIIFLALAGMALMALRQNYPTDEQINIPLVPAVLGESTEKIRGENQNQGFLPRKINALREIKLERISAKAFAVADEQSQTILLEKSPNEKLPIASLTKLMTVFLAYEKLNPDALYKITANDILDINPSLGLKAGDEVMIANLLESSLVCSSNDAAKALANAVQKQHGQNFTKLMNAKARELNLSETRFSNPLGFDSDSNYSSVSDLLKLAIHTQNLAIFKILGKRAEIRFTSKNGHLYSCGATNKLVGKNLEIENIKTGYTEKAKGSIIARVNRNGINLIVIVVGSQNREADLLKLSELAFENFEW